MFAYRHTHTLTHTHSYVDSSPEFFNDSPDVTTFHDENLSGHTLVGHFTPSSLSDCEPSGVQMGDLRGSATGWAGNGRDSM